MTGDVETRICRNCGRPGTNFHFAANDCSLDRCGACGFVQVRDIPADEDLKAIYRDAYFEKPKYVDDRAARHEFMRRLRMLNRQGLEKSWRVLDYGCASGDFVNGIAGFCEAWGIDYSNEAIAKAQAAHPELSDRFSPLAGLPADGMFDAVVMWDVIEHVPSPPDTLANIAKHLRPGGRLLVSTPNIGAPVARLMGRRWAFMTPPEHLGFLDRRSMKEAMDRAGFEIVDWSSRGKLVNVAFLLYKAGRVFPSLVPKWLWQSLAKSFLGGLCVYVPTGDIQYVVCRKRS